MRETPLAVALDVIAEQAAQAFAAGATQRQVNDAVAQGARFVSRDPLDRAGLVACWAYAAGAGWTVDLVEAARVRSCDREDGSSAHAGAPRALRSVSA